MTATPLPSPATGSAPPVRPPLVLTPLQAAALQELGISGQFLAQYEPHGRPHSGSNSVSSPPVPLSKTSAATLHSRAEIPQVRPQSLATLATHLAADIRQKVARQPNRPAPLAPERVSVPDRATRPAEASAWVLPDWAAQVLAQPDGAFELMVIGEAPGLHDETHAHPAQNRMGALLAAMLHAAGFKIAGFASGGLHPIFHTHLLAVRPLAQHGPSAPELAAGLARLRQQIAQLRPRRLLVLGEVAARALLGVEAHPHDLDTLRGQCHPYVQEDLRIPLVATYAPAVLLARPRYKAAVWQDLNVLAQSDAVSNTTTLAAMPSLRPR